MVAVLIFFMVTPAGLKPTTLGTGILRSIQLNYGAAMLFTFAFNKRNG